MSHRHASHPALSCPLLTWLLVPAGLAVINSVYARAVRNCPWVGQLWGRALRALERSGAPEEQHAALYDKALAAGLQVKVGWPGWARLCGVVQASGRA